MTLLLVRFAENESFRDRYWRLYETLVHSSRVLTCHGIVLPNSKFEILLITVFFFFLFSLYIAQPWPFSPGAKSGRVQLGLAVGAEGFDAGCNIYWLQGARNNEGSHNIQSLLQRSVSLWRTYQATMSPA
jgi:hypothetical protein